MEVRPNEGKFGKRWAREAAKAADAAMTPKITVEEEGYRRDRAQELLAQEAPVVGATPTLRRGKNRRAIDKPDSLPTRGRIEDSAGWPVGLLREEEEPEFEEPIDWDLADKLIELADKEGVLGDYDVEDLVPGNPHAHIVYQQLKDKYQILTPKVEERRSEARKKRVKREMVKMVNLAELESAREGNVIDVSVDLGRLVSQEKKIEIGRMAARINQIEKFMAKFWGNKALWVVIYDKSKVHPPRLRLIDPETKQEIFMSVSEWQNLFSSESLEIRFPGKQQSDEDKATWIMALKAVRIGGSELGAEPSNIFFSTDAGYQERIVPVINEINLKKKKKK